MTPEVDADFEADDLSVDRDWFQLYQSGVINTIALAQEDIEGNEIIPETYSPASHMNETQQ
jgi:hypothetical protein